MNGVESRVPLRQLAGLIRLGAPMTTIDSAADQIGPAANLGLLGLRIGIEDPLVRMVVCFLTEQDESIEVQPEIIEGVVLYFKDESYSPTLFDRIASEVSGLHPSFTDVRKVVDDAGNYRFNFGENGIGFPLATLSPNWSGDRTSIMGGHLSLGETSGLAVDVEFYDSALQTILQTGIPGT